MFLPFSRQPPPLSPTKCHRHRHPFFISPSNRHRQVPSLSLLKPQPPSPSLPHIPSLRKTNDHHRHPLLLHLSRLLPPPPSISPNERHCHRRPSTLLHPAAPLASLFLTATTTATASLSLLAQRHHLSPPPPKEAAITIASLTSSPKRPTTPTLTQKMPPPPPPFLPSHPANSQHRPLSPSPNTPAAPSLAHHTLQPNTTATASFSLSLTENHHRPSLPIFSFEV